MASRAEIEAQIAALKAVLKEKEIDPDFTPKELVRWDPSLLGTILHMKHPMNLPRTAFRVLFKNNGEYYGWVGMGSTSFSNTTSELKMEQLCPLTNEGIVVNSDLKFPGGFYDEPNLIYSIENTFQSMKCVPIISNGNPTESPLPTQIPTGDSIMAADTLGIRFKNIIDEHIPRTFGYLPLCGPDDNILDHIFIASVVKLPFQTKEVIVDKYPLSKLYEEWKMDKAAGRTQRGM
jgi:hypothetical protein